MELATINATAIETTGTSNNEAVLRRFCDVLGMDPQTLKNLLHALKRIEMLEQKCKYLEKCLNDSSSTSTTTVEQRCDDIWVVAKRACCPGNLLYSQITLDEYSDNAEVPLDIVVQDIGAPFQNALPVAPNQAIRFEQAARPGYLPSHIWIDFAFAGGGVNYLDLEIQFYLGPGGKDKGKAIGPVYRGNQFVHKDGRTEKLVFPKYRGAIVEVGSIEKMAVEIRHIGSANNLTSASIRLPYDEEAWYEYCKKVGGGC